MKVSDERAREIRGEVVGLWENGVARPIDKLILDLLDDREELLRELEKRIEQAKP